MISIGLPAYKSKYLKTAINSVLNQTYSNFEFIILNSYGNEKIRNIVLSYKDKRINYHENIDNPDVIVNWNNVLAYAKRDFFILFSDDDSYEPTYLEEMVSLSSKYKNCDIFYCRTRLINKKDLTNNYSVICPEYETSIEFIWGRLFGNRLQYAANFMVKRKELIKIGGFCDFPLAWCSDDATWFLLSSINGIAYSRKPLFNFRMSELNISKVGDYEKKLIAIDKFDKWFLKFISKFKVNSKYEKNLKNLILRDFHNVSNDRKKNIFNSYYHYQNILTFTLYFFKLKKKYNLKLYWILSIYKKFLFGNK